ncbi:MAG: glycosyltransferase family 2 protein [Planctomycetota bacterium]|nr:glycosyltransferase family 2 protein [Planctomycetota bacterium]
MDAPSSLTIIVPVYNEAATCGEAIRRLMEVEPPRLGDGTALRRNVVAVDDGSTDGSGAILLSLAGVYADLRVLKHPRNMGKGAAVRTGLEHATGDLVLIHDADLEYDPRDHAAVLLPLLEGRADAVIGSRFRGGTAHRVLYYWHSVANGVLTHVSNALTNLNLSDIECCTKAFTREVAAALSIEEDRFGVEPEIVAKLARLEREGGPLRIYEVPVSYAGRTYAQGKKITWRDGVRALWCIVRYRFV